MNQQALTLPSLSAFAAGQLAADFRLNFSIFSTLRQKLHNGAHAKPVTVMTRADFMHHVTLHMPEVAIRIEEDDFGILNLEVAAMKLATREAMARYELHTVRRHFSFMGYLLEHADRELHDAILVSYVEGLFLDNPAPECLTARRLLPANMEDALKKAELHFKLLNVKYFRLATRSGRQQPRPLFLVR